MAKDNKRGFTLLELLTVITIMVMLSSMAIASYFASVRGMTRRSAIKHLANTLVLARQRACMENARMSVMIFNEITGYDSKNNALVAPSFVICREIGQVTRYQGGMIYDEFTALDQYFGSVREQSKLEDDGKYSSIRLYNLAQGKWTCVFPKVLRRTITGVNLQDGTVANIPCFAFVKNNNVKNNGADASNWDVGSPYGIEVNPSTSLPKGFQFTKLEDDISREPMHVTFEPDGRIQNSSDTTIEIEEMLTRKTTKIKVRSDGTVTYDEKWN